MSWQATTFAFEYIEQMRRSSLECCKVFTANAWRSSVMRLPLHYVLEQLKAPLKNIDKTGGIFRILQEDVFYMDMLGESVLAPAILHQTFTTLMQREPHSQNTEADTHTFVWMVTHAHNSGCRALLHFTHRSTTGTRSTYEIKHLYLHDEELCHPANRVSSTGILIQPIHEVLLQAICTFADRRQGDIHIRQNVGMLCPVMQYLLAINGFLSVGEDHLMRPPWSEVVQSNEMLTAVDKQINCAIYTLRWKLMPACKTKDVEKSTVASTEPLALSRSESTKSDLLPLHEPNLVADTPLELAGIAGKETKAPREW